ncbi:hypothetical protein H696_03545 [Fonticula alba]|uniref:C2 domain-containing protein n=1 Tax=Fonticula alba TaxID=691883 RepID=A0A058Z851_FONAL|nr:hypothetical protein H696_03545 [Fonticula alba]KCV70083.1 hypothetical protein H696_03545 [Fonticula alba]|eukprot:XP_009495689.1 hypothetical protein H696_03545 [Fonticula alba]
MSAIGEIDDRICLRLRIFRARDLPPGFNACVQVGYRKEQFATNYAEVDDHGNVQWMEEMDFGQRQGEKELVFRVHLARIEDGAPPQVSYHKRFGFRNRWRANRSHECGKLRLTPSDIKQIVNETDPDSGDPHSARTGQQLRQMQVEDMAGAWRALTWLDEVPLGAGKLPSLCIGISFVDISVLTDAGYSVATTSRWKLRERVRRKRGPAMSWAGPRFDDSQVCPLCHMLMSQCACDDRVSAYSATPTGRPGPGAPRPISPDRRSVRSTNPFDTPPEEDPQDMWYTPTAYRASLSSGGVGKGAVAVVPRAGVSFAGVPAPMMAPGHTQPLARGVTYTPPDSPQGRRYSSTFQMSQAHPLKPGPVLPGVVARSPQPRSDTIRVDPYQGDLFAGRMSVVPAAGDGGEPGFARHRPPAVVLPGGGSVPYDTRSINSMGNPFAGEPDGGVPGRGAAADPDWNRINRDYRHGAGGGQGDGPGGHHLPRSHGDYFDEDRSHGRVGSMGGAGGGPGAGAPPSHWYAADDLHAAGGRSRRGSFQGIPQAAGPAAGYSGPPRPASYHLSDDHSQEDHRELVRYAATAPHYREPGSGRRNSIQHSLYRPPGDHAHGTTMVLDPGAASAGLMPMFLVNGHEVDPRIIEQALANYTGDPFTEEDLLALRLQLARAEHDLERYRAYVGRLLSRVMIVCPELLEKIGASIPP